MHINTFCHLHPALPSSAYAAKQHEVSGVSGAPGRSLPDLQRGLAFRIEGAQPHIA